MQVRQPPGNQVLMPLQDNTLRSAEGRSQSPTPMAFAKKIVGQCVVAGPRNEHSPMRVPDVHLGPQRPLLSYNKENAYFVPPAHEASLIHDSPKRVSKSKSGFSQNSSKFVSPKANFEADSILSHRKDPANQYNSHLTGQSQWSQASRSNSLRFKFKVYPTKIEKCQIDELGNEVPGGIVEVVQTNVIPFPRSERIQIRNMALPPGVKLVSSKYIHLPLPRESQEKLSENIALYNSIIDRQYFLARQPQQSEDVQHQLQQAEAQRLALAHDQMALLSQFVPSEQLWSQMMGAECMASLPLLEHPAAGIRASAWQNASKTSSLITPANMANVLAAPILDSKFPPNYLTNPNVFESLVNPSDDSRLAEPSPYSFGLAFDTAGDRNPLAPKTFGSYYQPKDQIGQTLDNFTGHNRFEMDDNYDLNDHCIDRHTQNNNTRTVEDKISIENTENIKILGSSEVQQRISKGEQLDKAPTLVSKDFNDWIEKGLFRQIHGFMSGQDKNDLHEKKTTILSLIAEVPEEKSESSPIKGPSSAQKDKSSMYGQTDDLHKNFGTASMSLQKSRAPIQKENSFYSTSTYPQENMEVGISKRSFSQDAIEEISKGHLGNYESRSMVPVPIFTSQKLPADSNTEPEDGSQSSTPVKMMGTVYFGNNPARLSYQGPRYSDYAIKEATVEDEEENAQDMRIKEMTPQQSADFKAQKINTDCSASLSGNEHSQILQGGNFNVVFPSLRFSSAKLDKSIQVRTSIKVSEGQTLEFGCNNFIYLDQNVPPTSSINAYMIEPMHVGGQGKHHIMQDEGVQTEGVSPFIATQIVQELLKSKDFAAEIQHADPHQGFTVTVTQDQANNDFVIDVEMSQDFKKSQQNLDSKFRDFAHQITSIQGGVERGSYCDIDNQFKLVSKTDSIKEMSEFGHTTHLLNFDFSKKDNFEETQRLAYDQNTGIHTITEREEQENSQGRSDSLEDDQVTIDNPLLKEYDATASPDKHARTSRLEEIFEHGGYRSATSEVIGGGSNPDSDVIRPNFISGEERDFFQSTNKNAKTPLYHIAEQSVEDSEQLRVSKQNNRYSGDYRDNQSEVFNSKAYEKLFGEATQVSDSKFDRVKRGGKSMTAYHSKEGLNTICEEPHVANDPTHSFVEFISKNDQNAITSNKISDKSDTPNKKMVEIEDFIKSKSGKKEHSITTNEQLQNSGISRSQLDRNSTVLIPIVIEPIVLDSKIETIYAIKHKDTKTKKGKGSRSKQSDTSRSRSKSKSVKETSSKTTENKLNLKKTDEIENPVQLEVLSLKIPDRKDTTTRDTPADNVQHSKKDTLSAKGVKDQKQTVNRRSPTPSKGKVQATSNDTKSVSQIKKGLSNDNLSYVSNNHSTLSPMTQKTHKKTATPVKSKESLVGEKPKIARRESSPYAPDKYKSTIQTLFHDQMGPAKKNTSSKTPSRAQKEKAVDEKQVGVRIDTSMTQFNQHSDCESYSVTSGHNRDFMRHHKMTSENVRGVGQRAGAQNSSFTHVGQFGEPQEQEGHKSHRSTRSHMPAPVKAGLGPLFEDPLAEQRSTGRDSHLKRTPADPAPLFGLPSSSLKKVTSPQLGFHERLSKNQRLPECNSLSKNSQGKQSTQTFGNPDQMKSKPTSQRQSFVRNSAADNILRDRILNEFITGLCATGILNEDDCANENFFIENEAIMINFESMVAICAEIGFLPDDFDLDDESFGRWTELLNAMWFILGGEQADSICIQDLSVFILAVFGLGLNCIVEDGADEDMFDEAEVREIQAAYQIFHAQKVLRDEGVQRPTDHASAGKQVRTSLSLAAKKRHRTVVEFINEQPNGYLDHDLAYQEDNCIEEEPEEDDQEDRFQHNNTEHLYQNDDYERPQRLTLKSRTNYNDSSFISRNNPPKSFMSSNSSPMLLLDVNLGGGKIERVMMHEGDDPEEIADRIIRENSSPHLT